MRDRNCDTTRGLAHPARRTGLAGVCAVFVLAGCGGGGADRAPKPGREVQIGVSILTRSHPFYNEIEAGLVEAATQRGYHLDIQAGEFDDSRQKDQVRGFIARKVDAIVLSACDSNAIGPAVEAANRAGIPVFTTDIAVLAPGARVVSHVASDNVAGGRLAAEALVQALGDKGSVAIIDHPEVESVMQRVRGFEEEVARHPKMKIVGKLSGGGTRDGAFRTTREMLRLHPNLVGIFAINDDSALGAAAALKALGTKAPVAVVGFDAMPEAREAIAKGTLYGDVVQQPREIARKTIADVAAHLSGQPVASVTLVACKLFTRADAGSR